MLPSHPPSAQTPPGNLYNDIMGNDDAPVLCHCGVEARYVRGKSGNGWLCGNEDPAHACEFRLRDTAMTP